MCSVVALLAVVSRLIRAAYLCDAIRQKAAPPTGCATQPRLACPFSNAPRVVDPANRQSGFPMTLQLPSGLDIALTAQRALKAQNWNQVVT